MALQQFGGGWTEDKLGRVGKYLEKYGSGPNAVINCSDG